MDKQNGGDARCIAQIGGNTTRLTAILIVIYQFSRSLNGIIKMNVTLERLNQNEGDATRMTAILFVINRFSRSLNGIHFVQIPISKWTSILILKD